MLGVRLTRRGFSSQTAKQEVWILGAARTPIGSFNGVLASLQAPQLGGLAAKAAIARSGVKAEEVDEMIMGNVVGSGQGQCVTRQAARVAGLPWPVSCTTVNKVCSSGMKSTMFGAQSIQLGYNKVVVSGGCESMTNIPYYLPRARQGLNYGHAQLQDGILQDGLWDMFDNHHMGNAGEVCAKQYNISRKEQDDYALESYRRAAEASKAGKFKEEITPVTVSSRKGDTVISR